MLQCRLCLCCSQSRPSAPGLRCRVEAIPLRDLGKVKINGSHTHRALELTFGKTGWDTLILWNPGFDDASEWTTATLGRKSAERKYIARVNGHVRVDERWCVLLLLRTGGRTPLKCRYTPTECLAHR